MVCIFDNQATRFEPSHEQGKITGTIAGKPFEGKGWLKVIPVKRKHKDKDRHHTAAGTTTGTMTNPIG